MAGRPRHYAAKCRTSFETNYLQPFQGGPIVWIYPGVKTPCLVLLSLRDKSGAPLTGGSICGYSRNACFSRFKTNESANAGVTFAAAGKRNAVKNSPVKRILLISTVTRTKPKSLSL
jgi:hypothetical protein